VCLLLSTHLIKTKETKDFLNGIHNHFIHHFIMHGHATHRQSRSIICLKSLIDSDSHFLCGCFSRMPPASAESSQLKVYVFPLMALTPLPSPQHHHHPHLPDTLVIDAPPQLKPEGLRQQQQGTTFSPRGCNGAKKKCASPPLQIRMLLGVNGDNARFGCMAE